MFRFQDRLQNYELNEELQIPKINYFLTIKDGVHNFTCQKLESSKFNFLLLSLQYMKGRLMMPNFFRNPCWKENRVLDIIRTFHLELNMNFLEVCEEDVSNT